MAQIETIVAAFLGIVLLASLVSRRIRTPYTIILVLVGLLLAAVPAGASSGVVTVFNGLATGGLFIGLILPPLLFESIMSIRVEDFRAVSRPALILATLGVLVATVVGGVVLWKVVGLAPFPSFLFAALISPTDVATVLEIFARVTVPVRLATLVEMESVFNDATGIAIFAVVLAYTAESNVQFLVAAGDFAYSLGGGVAVGLLVAWGARQLQKRTHDLVSQVVLTIAAVYGAFGIAVSVPPLPFLHASPSGVIAVAVTGLFYGNTILLGLESRSTADSLREFWRVMAFLANGVAFFFIGVSTNIFSLGASAGAILVAYGVVMMARISSVYPILSLTRVEGALIPSSWMNVTALGGMRGALAIALVSAIPDDALRAQVATLTFGVVMLSIVFQSPLLVRYAGRTFGRQATLPISTGTEAAAA